ncbi:hypothetical protein KKD57_03190 [Patescibacteria group bacterium]|nr:hypothetical protein [Patescibacteria group bacterium]
MNYLTKELQKFIKKNILRQKLNYPALEAYYNRLPLEIEVKWKRDGKFIVGCITADNNQFMTQAYNAKEFIEMVNDAVVAVYDIPDDYIDAISNLKTYIPKPEVMKTLNDGSITESSFDFIKNKEALKVA